VATERGEDERLLPGSGRKELNQLKLFQCHAEHTESWQDRIINEREQGGGDSHFTFHVSRFIPNMSARKEFLVKLFEGLEERGVPYCVLRNYEKLYEDAASDVDLLAERKHLSKVEECLSAAAEISGYRLVQRVRHVSFSLIYWRPDAGFLRIDVQWEVRWRVFPVLNAVVILSSRRKHDAFFIPHPKHESVVLIVAALWRSNLSERYRQQLARLSAQLSGPEDLIETFSEAFGAIGADLARSIPRKEADAVTDSPVRLLASAPTEWRAVRRSLVRKALLNPACLIEVLDYVVEDAVRLLLRLRHPPGISLVCASTIGAGTASSPGSGSKKKDAGTRPSPPLLLHEFLESVDFLFPKARAIEQSCSLAGDPTTSLPGLSLRQRWQRMKTLVKGGVFARSYHFSSDADMERATREHADFFYRSRTFIWIVDSNSRIYLRHVGTGATVELGQETADLLTAIIEFVISGISDCDSSDRPRR